MQSFKYMQSFIEERFPEDISYGMSGGPEFFTDVVTTNSGFEQRNINWMHPRNRYNIAHGVRTESQLHHLLKFFYNIKGKAIGFRFKDWTDFKTKNELISVADGKSKIFQLIKSYNNYKRIITKPVNNTVRIYVNDILAKADVNYINGVISLYDIPSKNSKITADFEFDVPVRFDVDNLSISMETYGKYSCHEISLIEVRI